MVGHTPGGKSPFDVHDMAGNVLEWCLNTSPDTPDERGKARPVRGGSWLLPGSAARSAGRGSFDLDDRGTTDLGFRVVCRPKERD
jgi:formylglycine-generating enzyme required for sulfatase activity